MSFDPVRLQSASSPIYYLNQLTSLLESIAHIIDQHQPVVDKYYGKGRTRTVVGRLVGESDRVVRNLVEGWEEDRRVGRLISETKQTPFTLLSQPTLLPPLFTSLLNPATGQMTLSSLASSTTSALPTSLSSAGNLLQSYTKGGQRAPAPTPSPAPVEEEEKGPDSRDVDRVLGELVALGGRWALFKRFVWGRIAVSSQIPFLSELMNRMTKKRLNQVIKSSRTVMPLKSRLLHLPATCQC
jgi:hypothetical protein